MFNRTRSARRGAIAVALCAIFGSAGAAIAAPGSSAGHRSDAAHRHGPEAACRLGTCGTPQGGDAVVDALVRTGLSLAFDGRRGRGWDQRGDRCDAPFRCGHRDWVEGRVVWRTERVCVAEARVERIWVEPVYQTRYDACGVPYRVCIRDGYHRTVRLPARYESVRRQHQVPGYWRPCSRRGVHHHRTRGGSGGQRGRHG